MGDGPNTLNFPCVQFCHSLRRDKWRSVNQSSCLDIILRFLLLFLGSFVNPNASVAGEAQKLHRELLKANHEAKLDRDHKDKEAQKQRAQERKEKEKKRTQKQERRR